MKRRVLSYLLVLLLREFYTYCSSLIWLIIALMLQIRGKVRQHYNICVEPAEGSQEAGGWLSWLHPHYVKRDQPP